MNSNEQRMKVQGEKRVWNTIMTKDGNFKKISSTQIGQQLLFDEALTILPLVRKWIDEGTAKLYRAELQEYFKDDDILLQKIVQSFLFLSGSIYEDVGKGKKTTSSRHKKIKTLKDKIMPELDFNQTWRFIEAIIDLSDYFTVESLLNFNRGSFKWNLKYICTLSETILGKLALESAEAFYPMPMIVPPIPWSYEDDKIVGGYEDFQYELIRTSKKNIDYSLYSQSIFDSINYIQSTPWKVNLPLLHQVKKDLRIPKKVDFIKTPYPDSSLSRWDIDLKECELSKKEIKEIESIRAVFKEKVQLYNADVGDYESALGKYRAVKLAIQIAERYIDETLYFPHSFDTRGRIYPIPIGLSPQGSDVVKSLLLYKNTEKLTERGIKWNWAYLASLYGDDKITFEERVLRGQELLDADYLEADEPYQFLSHQIELEKWVNDLDYIPNTRIHLDACNSGSQFTSAITGDRKGCLATNVIPTFKENGVQERKDAYMLVAEKSVVVCNDMIREGSSVEAVTIEFLRGLLEENGRKICKTPVMVSNYGGTAGGRAEILWDMLRELQVDRKWITKKIATLFSRIIGDSIQGVLVGGKAFEIYIHKMNNVIARDNREIYWDTSDGFRVIHIKNKELKPKQVSCLLPGARRTTTITKKSYSSDVSPSKMKSAISPNYIHSLDAELLRRVALKMERQGIENSDWIHDSFGCHPNYVDEMLDITKKEFSKLVRRAPLYVLDQQLREQAPDTKEAEKALDKIKIPHLRGFNASEGGLDIVMESEWFFS